MSITIDAPGKSCQRSSALWIIITAVSPLGSVHCSARWGTLGQQHPWRDGPDPRCVLQRTQIIQNAGEAALGSSGSACGPEPTVTPFAEQSPRQGLSLPQHSVTMRQEKIIFYQNLTNEVWHSRPRPQKRGYFCSHMSSSSGIHPSKARELLSLL